ncbi:MAG: hypothetical protein H0U41_02690 [Actinobacteria bacterium]|nr:hypothetical protein [Actinomycetota bacterium]
MQARAGEEVAASKRHLAVDERGVGLRATWHLARGLVNLSLWRGDRCIETFHLTPVQAGQLVGFLVSGLADSVAEPQQAQLAVVPDSDEGAATSRLASGATNAVDQSRRQLADVLDRAAARLRR